MGLAESAHAPVVVLEGVWKRFPPAREPHALSRVLARLGGVELDGGIPLDDLDEDDEVEEEVVAEPVWGEDASLDALRGVSLSIEPGVCLGIVGPPGAGKSVLLRLVAGLAPPSAGRIVVRGTVAPALSSIARLVPSRVGVPKTILALAMMTRLSRSDAKRRLPEILELAGLPDAGMPGRTLTAQQMKRVLLAMMLSVEADLVLVDVPFESGRSRERFVERIAERRRAGATIVIAADTVDEIADVADRFVYLEDGQLVDEEAQAEFRLASEQETAAGATAPSESPLRGVPLSNDAARYLDYIRVLVGDRRAEKAYRLAADKAPAGAERVEWLGIAQCAGFDYVEHLPVVERLRRRDGVEDEEPIFGPHSRRTDLPLSRDAQLYLDYIRVLAGEDRTEQAYRNAIANVPEPATRVEWTWIARWAGFDYVKHVPVIERLRALHGVGKDEPIFGAREARRKQDR